MKLGSFIYQIMLFFKALLFLGAGSVIHAVADEQDMRKMGGLKNIMPFSYAIILIGSLALIGFPFLTGFYSKDTILELAYAKYTVWGHFCYFLGTFAAFFTAFYSTRLIFLVFLAEPNGNRIVLINAHEGSWRLTFPLFLLAILSILIGYLTKDLFIGFGTDFWNGSIFILPANSLITDVEFIDLFFKQLPLLLTLLGVLFAYFMYVVNIENYYSFKQTSSFKLFYNFLSRKWYFDRIYNQFISQKVLYLSYVLSYKDLDRGIIEVLGPSGIVSGIKSFNVNFKELQSGNIFHYLFIFLFSILIFLFFIIILPETNKSLLFMLIIFFCFYIFFNYNKKI